MKKKIFVIISVVLCVLIVAVFVFSGMGISWHTGRYLLADNGSHMIIMDSSPIALSDKSEGKMFENLTNGDKILVFHNGIDESYPGSTRAYMCFKIGEGEITDIPENVLTSLDELGWIQYEESD